MNSNLTNSKKIIKVSKAIAKTIIVKLKNETILLSRVACLGQDVIKLKYGKKIHLINQQKTRIDLFLDWINGAPRPLAKMIEPHLLRKDILFTLVQQEELPWLNMKMSDDIILIDSYSELTDQKFKHRTEGWAFACNYSDINHSDSFEEQFESLGLLDLNELEGLYKRYFKYINKKYPRKKILFLHFPTVLDNRKQFIERGAEILKIINKLSLEYKNLISIDIPEENVSPHEDDNFPYHYGKETYKAFLKEINSYLL